MLLSFASMDWVRTAAFLAATIYGPGRALSLLFGPSPLATRLAIGLSATLVLCAAPFPGALVLGAAVVSALVVAFRRSGPAAAKGGRLWAAAPGLALGVALLSIGPFRDVSLSPDGDLSYRTGGVVGSRSAGPYPTLPEAALVAARAGGDGDPFVSGTPLPRRDPFRTYASLAARFTGLSLYTLVGRLAPALLLLGVLAALPSLFPDRPLAAALGGVLFFGSGLGFLAAVLPLIRSWPHRIWLFLTDSTGLAALATEPLALLALFLAVAGLRERRASLLVGLALALVEPGLVLPLALALLFVWRRGSGPALVVGALGAVVAALFLGRPFAPLLRALEYARLEHLAALVEAPTGSVESALRTLLLAAAFVPLCLGARSLGLAELLAGLRGETPETLRPLYALAAALALAGLLGLGPERVWSLGLLLLWLPFAVAARRALGRATRRRRAVYVLLGAALVFPASFDYLRHLAFSPYEVLPAADVALGRDLAAISAPGDPVLHRPNRSELSLASHVSFRPSVLCYYGRTGSYDARELETRSRDVRRFFETTDAATAREIVARYRVALVVVERHRPLRFGAAWLERVGDGENLVAYAVH